MRINAPSIFSINDRNNKQPNFCALKIDKSALPIIDNMSKEDILEFKQIKKRLSKTKFWDMKIFSVDNALKSFNFQFIHKKNKHSIITDGIFPYNQEGDTISIYTFIYGIENVSQNILEKLKFKSPKRAAEVFDQYNKNMEYVIGRVFNISPLENLKNKEFEINMLEEASRTAKISKSAKSVNTGILTKETTGNDFCI